MPADLTQPQPNFDRIARLYRWAEYLTLGPLLQQTRTAHLDRLADCRQALLFGDGDGRFLARLLARNPALHATAVDTSAAMLRLLRTRCRQALLDAATRLTTLQASAFDAPIPPATDLIVTHFFLDCLSQTEVDELTTRLAESLQPGTLLLVSDFAIPATPLLRGAARLYIRALYLAFRLLTGLRVQALPDPQAALLQSGFRLVARHAKLLGLLYSELWVFDNPAREQNNPPVPSLIHTPMAPVIDHQASSAGSKLFPADPLPDPEPIAPSLAEPDLGVFHHEPGQRHPPALSESPSEPKTENL